MVVGVVIYVVIKGGLKDNDERENPDNPVGGSTTEAARMLRGALGW